MSAAVEERREQRVTSLELFFDLVFVFAITQVTSYLGAELTWPHLLEGLAVLAALWWAWVAYAWVADAAGSEDGAARVVLLAAMAAMLVVALAVPEAFGDGAVWFAGSLLVVRLLHLALYLVVSRQDPGLRRVVKRLAGPLSVGPALLVVGALAPDGLRALCWAAGLLVDYAGPLRGAGHGSRVHPGHFAERFGLVVIIVLGESIVSIGVGAEGLRLDGGLVLAVLLAGAVSAALWWAYFDVVALVAEDAFWAARGLARVRLARDAYMYLHTLLVTGVVVLALGLKKTIAHLHDALPVVAAVALCAGPALYLLGLVLVRRRTAGTWSRARVLAVVALTSTTWMAVRADAITSLALVALLCVALVAWETVADRERRRRVRGARRGPEVPSR